ncbi:sulfite exporter TauE/SafE family protein [Geminocystis sp.]|uniref:sulfite exporter TauE/SafE family protein n=1 Tax=Geminocystis sp. TaxID=2664100 RepID=UPI00359465D4
MRLTFGLFLGIFVGLTLGLIGGGGSILAVPILKYVIGASTKEAIAMSLFIVGIVSIIGLIPHWRQGNVNFSIALIFIPPAMIGSFLGAKISDLPIINETIQLISFGIIMLLASILMILKSNQKYENKDIILPEKKEIIKNKYSQLFITIIEGFGVGILTGFVGVGGGFLIIPALVLVGGIPMKEAVGTSLIIIAFNSVSGFAGYLNQVNLNWLLMISFTVAASIGIIMGGYLSEKINAKYLQKGFGYFVLTVAIFILIVR